MKPQLEWGKLKFYKKGGVRKRKTGINRRRVFKIALEGGREGGNGNFAWKSFDYSILLSCERQNSVNID